MASSSTLPVAQKWAYKEQKMEKVNYVWTKNIFTDYFHDRNFSDSPVFSADGNKTVWQLRLGNHEVYRGMFFINIFLKFAQEKEVTAIFKYSVVNGKHEKLNLDSREAHRIEKGNFSKAPFLIPSDFLFKNQLHVEKITIFCDIFDVGDCVNTSGQPSIEVADSKLSEDFSKLLDDEKFTDVTLVVDGHECRAHKAILAARSAVFAAMFEHEFEERKSNCVEITDIQPEVLWEMLRFIYTGKAPNINKLAKNLLIAADKYALERLSLMCEDVLSVNLNIETAAETLILADRHSAKQLKAITLAFINMHAIAVMQTPDWQKIIETNAYLLAEAFQVFAAQHCPKIKPTRTEK
ncbi:protein roadkill-like [Calliphora vicina]|uniref:protein roadkill-like n=1 Tax=Calliphora vicina TaxID=7373 RepID=UPI00325A4545